MKKIIIIAALMCGSAQAEFMDGNKLLSDLQSSDSGDRMFAMGYITGIADSARSNTFCPHPNVTIGQMRDAVRQHLDGAPTLRHYSADIIVNYVLKQGWPCKKGTSL